MSIETQIQNKVKELLDKINESIPTIWDSLFVHLEMAEGGGTVYFFFKEEGESDYHYSVQIPMNLITRKKYLYNSTENNLVFVKSYGISFRKMSWKFGLMQR